MRVLLSGGGTLGSVTPLLALVEELRHRMKKNNAGHLDALWIGTRGGVERALVVDYNIAFIPIYAGKLRTYFDVRNIIDPFLLCIGIMQSCIAIIRFQPDIIIGAGGYVSVPALWAGWLLRKRSALLQLDIAPSLSNLLTAFCASAFFVSCEDVKRYFPARKTRVVGIPVRRALAEWQTRLAESGERNHMRAHFGVHDDAPIILAVGGGTGAAYINTLILECLPMLVKRCHIIHVTGKAKGCRTTSFGERYHPFEFLSDDLIGAMIVADVIVTRAGMGSLAEASFLKKACIIIPIPDSQQERNALYVEKHRGGIYCSQKSLTPEQFIEKAEKLLADDAMRGEYADALQRTFPTDARERIIDELLKI